MTGGNALERAFEHALRVLAVARDGDTVPGWRGRTLSGPVRRDREPLWLRLVSSPSALAQGAWWTGTADSAVLPALPKPVVLAVEEWDPPSVEGFRLRAELMTRLPGRALSPTAELALETEVDPAVWVELGEILDALAAVPTQRESTVPATVDRLLHSFFGDRFPRGTPCWTTAHGDLHPGNLLVAPLGLADWEAWGRGPEHLDVATLYVHSLAAPDARRSLVEVLGERLHSDAALPALAFAAAKVLARSVSGDYPTLVDPVHRLLDDLSARPLGAGGTTARRR
ncbi:phosphotransferase [Rathayibacter sp. VKM Ac-2927]|uniref:phosphotransferase n=1 Tax=Rathayibacter sp. VKM Ac-2927 TaxID=2929478 RepID=UPI001FB28661|nr:phosphotransferase [Rathayibacter sp. VKM Ac-2927]MCJ1685895.1 hypothetical protein [Rathayibacter sp. VKM Ac-2927]